VAVVTIHEPRGEEYGGGTVAAPAFAKIAAGAMRILNVAPDNDDADDRMSLRDRQQSASQTFAWSEQ